jgi:hypothetical protein
VKSWPSTSTRRVPGRPDVVFAFHDREEIGPRMLARIAKHPGLTPEAFSKSRIDGDEHRRSDSGSGRLVADRPARAARRCWLVSGDGTASHAGMVELVDTGDLKSPDGNVVRVRVPVPAFLVKSIGYTAGREADDASRIA